MEILSFQQSVPLACTNTVNKLNPHEGDVDFLFICLNYFGTRHTMDKFKVSSEIWT